MESFEGSPAELGNGYGRRFAGQIRENLRILVWREGYEPLPRQDPGFIAWMEQQRALIKSRWPWLLEEIKAVATAVDVSEEDIFLLNLRAWNYRQSAFAGPGCSSLVIKLADGTVACAGALDDPVKYYCGPVRIVPEKGFRYITFPITGTSWGNRGMNSAGLVLSESSQGLRGLNPLRNTIVQDIALRVILQTCATVKDVGRFCRKYPFAMNTVCSDAEGGVFCAHQTVAGLQVMTRRAPFAMTNHIVDDRLFDWCLKHGVGDFEESKTTRFRRGKLLQFIKDKNGKCTAEEVRALIADKDNGSPSSICPPGNVALTYGNAQAEQGTLWVAQPRIAGQEAWQAYSV